MVHNNTKDSRNITTIALIRLLIKSCKELCFKIWSKSSTFVRCNFMCERTGERRLDFSGYHWLVETNWNYLKLYLIKWTVVTLLTWFQMLKIYGRCLHCFIASYIQIASYYIFSSYVHLYVLGFWWNLHQYHISLALLFSQSQFGTEG